jgi:signal peptidase II
LQAPGRAGAVAPPRSYARTYVPLLAAAAIVFALDQFTKQLMLSALADGPIVLIDGLLRWNLTLNSGGAFGVGQDLPGLFLVATVGIIGTILVVARRVTDSRWLIPLGCVLGGGLGNAYDRVFRDLGGGVIDFIDLYVWPVFNVADIAIVTGALVMFVMGWREKDADPAESD